MILNATISDATKLTEIALKSKAFWGYSDALISSWKEDLTVSEKMISEMIVCKFLKNDEVVGFYILNQPIEKSIELEFLFVLPDFIGEGIGNTLIHHAFKNAQKLNCKQVMVLSDPNAFPFYKSKGFYETDKKESAISGRFLPIMQKDLEG